MLDGAKGIKSIEVGYRVLLAVQRGPGAVPLKEIADRTGLTGGAVHNYIVSFVRTGLIEQESRGRYKLGPSAFALSLSSFDQLNGYSLMREEALSLFRRTAQSVGFAVWSQGGPVSVFVHASDNAGSLGMRPGRLSMTSTAAGIVYAGLIAPKLTLDPLRLELADAKGGSTAEIFIERARAMLSQERIATYENPDIDYFAIGAPVISQSRYLAGVLTLVQDEGGGRIALDMWRKTLLDCVTHASNIATGVGMEGPLIE